MTINPVLARAKYGFGHAVRLDTPKGPLWHVIDAYGPMDDLGSPPMSDTEYDVGRWTVVYAPDALPAPSVDVLPHHTLKRSPDKSRYVLKLDQPEGYPAWMELDAVNGFGMLTDVEVSDWEVLYMPSPEWENVH